MYGFNCKVGNQIGGPELRPREVSRPCDEVAVVHLLLGSAILRKVVGVALAVAQVLHDFSLLLGVAVDFDLPALQFLELCQTLMPRGDSPNARAVTSQIELHFRRSQALPKFPLQVAQEVCPLVFSPLHLQLRLVDFPADDLKALALPPFKTLAAAQHGLQWKSKGHEVRYPGNA